MLGGSGLADATRAAADGLLDQAESHRVGTTRMTLELNNAIEQYLTFLRVERGLSAATIAAYATDLRAFARDAAVSGDAWQHDANVATNHLAALSRPPRTLKPSSHRRKAASIRAFYRFCFGEGLIDRDVASLLDLPRASRQLPDTLDVKEVEALLEAPDAATAAGIRARALLELLYSCGLRVSEALNLDMEDVAIAYRHRARHRQGRPRAAAAHWRGRARCHPALPR